MRVFSDMGSRKMIGRWLLGGFLCCLIGCGSASNNDQGVSFTLFGFFQDTTGAVGLAGLVVPLNDSTAETPGNVGLQTATIGLQSNLIVQFIRLERVFLSFSIAGASEQPPDTSYALGGVVGSPGANPNYLEILIVPPEIRAWISLNRTSLPDTPFTGEVSVYVRGVTSAGDVLDTNAESLPLVFTTDNIIPPTEGDGDSSSSSSAGASFDDDVTE